MAPGGIAMDGIPEARGPAHLDAVDVGVARAAGVSLRGLDDAAGRLRGECGRGRSTSFLRRMLNRWVPPHLNVLELKVAEPLSHVLYVGRVGSEVVGKVQPSRGASLPHAPTAPTANGRTAPPPRPLPPDSNPLSLRPR